MYALLKESIKFIHFCAFDVFSYFFFSFFSSLIFFAGLIMGTNSPFFFEREIQVEGKKSMLDNL